MFTRKLPYDNEEVRTKNFAKKPNKGGIPEKFRKAIAKVKDRKRLVFFNRDKSRRFCMTGVLSKRRKNNTTQKIEVIVRLYIRIKLIKASREKDVEVSKGVRRNPLLLIDE